MSRYADLPYVRANLQGGQRSRTQMIVIHATDNPNAGAADEAAFCSRRTDASCHFYSDEHETYQCVDTSLVAFNAYPTANGISVQFELCGRSGAISDATMREAAPIVARACVEWNIPVVKLTGAQLQAGARGICGHRDVVNAWHEGNHTDPEPFPWATFLGYVQAAIGSGEESDMPIPIGPIPLPHSPGAHENYSIPPVNAGGLPWGRAWLSLFGDFFGGKARFRIALSDGAGRWKFLGVPLTQGAEPRVILESGVIYNVELPTGIRGISVIREQVDADDPATASASFSIEYGTR